MNDHHNWAVVLAGGNGTRLQTLTTDPDGVAVPKQFWSLNGGPTLLQLALERARRVVPPDHTYVVLDARHQTWWGTEQASITSGHVIVQPCNRGTAIGVLLAVLTVLTRDADARVVFLPADHFVARERVLAKALRRGIARDIGGTGRMVLLGIESEEPDPDLGYIVPGWPVTDGLFTVLRFLEKPSRAVAEHLIARGGLWNSFIFAANAASLHNLIARHYPLEVAAMTRVVNAIRAGGVPRAELVALYDRLLPCDFSGDVLTRATERLLVRRVPSCGWSDLGTPQRVLAALRVAPRRASAPLTRYPTRSLLAAVTARLPEWREHAAQVNL